MLGIVASQMVTTLVMCISSSIFPDTIGELFRRPEIAIVAGVGLMSSICALACNRKLRMMVPYNYILLLILTLCEAFFISAITSRLEPTSVGFCICAFALVTSCLFFAAVYTSPYYNAPDW